MNTGAPTPSGRREQIAGALKNMGFKPAQVQRGAGALKDLDRPMDVLLKEAMAHVNDGPAPAPAPPAKPAPAPPAKTGVRSVSTAAPDVPRQLAHLDELLRRAPAQPRKEPEAINDKPKVYRHPQKSGISAIARRVVTPTTVGGGAIAATLALLVYAFTRGGSSTEPGPIAAKAPASGKEKPRPSTSSAPNPRVYTVQTGDRPHLIAKRYLGRGYDAKRPQWWLELQLANPSKKLAAIDRWMTLVTGEQLNIPETWPS